MITVITKNGNSVRVQGTEGDNLSEDEAVELLYEAPMVGFLLSDLLVIDENGNTVEASVWYDNHS